MATPSTARRVTRSQTLSALNNTNNSNNVPAVSRKIEDPEKSISKSTQRNGKQQDRSALIDVTNDSPIVGLATGTAETPSSGIAKQRGSRVKNTPGSGEALLRGQVKTLLQKVEEEAELSKISLKSRPFLQLVNSPVGLLAPTPANTPQIPNLSSGGDGCVINNTGFDSIMSSPTVEEQLIPEVMNHIFYAKDKENLESEKNQVTRSLLLDFSDKSEISESSEGSPELTFHEVAQESSSYKEKPSSCIEDDDASIWSVQVNASTHDEDEKEIAEEEGEEEEEGSPELTFHEVAQESSSCKEKPSSCIEDDDASIWSVQVNASTHDEDEEEIAEEGEKEEEEEVEYYDDIEEEEEEYDGGLLDELCECINSISVNDKVAPKFAGKHTRFVYNSDEELVDEEEEDIDGVSASPNMLRLKGLPTPKGKHLRFPDEE